MADDPEAGHYQAEAAHDHQVDREAAVEGGDSGTGQDNGHAASVPSGVLDHDGRLEADIIQIRCFPDHKQTLSPVRWCSVTGPGVWSMRGDRGASDGPRRV